MSAPRKAVDHGFLSAPCIDLGATLDGGQSFRWWAEDGGYRGVVGRRVLRLSAVPGGVHVEALDGKDASAALACLREYLGLDDDLDALRSRHVDDAVLAAAMDAYPGLRLLRQDPWECLVGFICSATASIGRIKMNVASIASAFGDRIGLGERDFAFPSPPRLAEADVRALEKLRLGFHAKYVAAAAEAVAAGSLELAALRAMPYLHARAVLMALPGVAEKIADCVLAFSLGKGKAFPVDRWVRRAVRDPNGHGLLPTMSDGAIGEWARGRFGLDAAYVNQYLFHWERLKDSRSRSAAVP